ncbi:MAG: T9SS type A sorting domain-containing protein [Ignavibacteriales bacterium]|nr:T9SS type A sorting domain-containing protein [Ignavibacteriales bacterium]MBP9121329.1 T9SS type A sorting domain-containing protein [Ignavibacterium sp.]
MGYSFTSYFNATRFALTNSAKFVWMAVIFLNNNCSIIYKRYVMKKVLLFLSIVLSCVFGSNTIVNAQVDVYLDHLNIYVTTYGRIAIYSLPDTTRQVYKTAILVGTGPTTVSDLENDYDVEEPTQLLSTPTFGDYEIYGSYNNAYSSNPPDVLVKQNVYCWQNQNSIIVKYTLINREPNSIDAIIGHELIPEVQGTYAGNDTVRYSTASKIISVTKNEAVGYKPLSNNFKSLGAFVYYSDYWLGDTTFYRILTYSSFDSLFITDPNDPNVDGPVLIPAYNSSTIATGDSVEVYLAIAYGSNETTMLASLEQAQQKYNQLTSVESDLNNIPLDFTLEQNYPNPFNPSTKISFGLPQRSSVVLKVFNTLGQEVAELVNESLEAGTHSYSFDASKLTSGVYVYSLQTDAGVISKKMTLVK